MSTLATASGTLSNRAPLYAAAAAQTRLPWIPVLRASLPFSA
jgi:hypothetical protein